LKFDSQKRHRRSIRLKGYDYTQPGAYFVTLVTYDRVPLFGEIVNGEMQLNPLGEIARAEWFQTAVIRPYVVLHPDEFVAMPNHVHGIIWIVDDTVGAQRRCAPTDRAVGGATPTNVIPGSLGAIVRSFKSATTKRINVLRGASGDSIWQRNYYEHIIRSERALNAIRRYILNNPAKWTKDAEYLEMTP